MHLELLHLHSVLQKAVAATAELAKIVGDFVKVNQTLFLAFIIIIKI